MGELEYFIGCTIKRDLTKMTLKIYQPDFGDSSQLNYWVLDLGATCHMAPQVSDSIPGSLENTDKYIEVANEYHLMEKQKGQVQIKMCDDNVDTFITTFLNVLLERDLCDGLFSIFTLMNLVYNCLFYKGFCTVYFGDREKMRLLYHIVHRGNMHFWGK